MLLRYWMKQVKLRPNLTPLTGFQPRAFSACMIDAEQKAERGFLGVNARSLQP